MENVDELLSSLISDIHSYTDKDPLLPWLRAIRKIKDTLPPKILKEKLPAFLQKCAHTFELDRRYRNDMRYIRVWLHLMDFVSDPKTLLSTMEVNRIGTKRSEFYLAYALYYEKCKKYDEAERMYHVGVKNLAEPLDKLQKSYEQFLQRMEQRKNNRRIQHQEAKTARKPLSLKSSDDKKTEGSKSNGSCCLEGVQKGPEIQSYAAKAVASDKNLKTKKDESKKFRGDDTVVVKFVDTAMVGKSEAEDACHHGLVDPTINMKEAMNAINSMFREPLEIVPSGRKSHKNHSKENRSTKNEFEVFVDENLDHGIKPSASLSLQKRTEASQPHQEPLQIYIDGEEHSEDSNTNLSEGGSASSTSQSYGFVFLRPRDITSEKSSDMDADSCRNSKFREDTVVCKFVGSTILDEPEVENVCHHGLVDPTINLKEAMDDINNMFGKPIDFVRKRRTTKQEKAPQSNRGNDFGGFSILADDDHLEQQVPPPPKLPGKSKERDLFEPTLLTKEAMDDINKMFNMPLNF
ncbi:probable inactive serine/threonine-protein kinase bub1 [Vigna radiata var. radiata]|uniref:Probable inactive serine/threonine-protein kinase bub1 n=1 Tax=Vigna radiata var. radiata TaxID=3916 RepID=A0A1S3THK2_VIGRR|nr:probable inactive serine/threonine-protein kinase bub1 [Vigna radiata var. radiata]